MRLFDWLKTFPFIKRFGQRYLIKKEFKNDAKEFANNYMYSNEDVPSISYEILLLVHSLEKGMASNDSEMRPFGQEKVMKLIKLLKCYQNLTNNITSPFLMGISVLDEWLKLYKLKGWPCPQREEIESYTNEFKDDLPKVGLCNTTINELNESIQSDLLQALSTRHTLRSYKIRKLDNKDVEYALEVARIAPSACNRQMCKIYYVKDEEKKNLLNNTVIGIGGLDKENINYFICTFDIKAFSYSGERNQGYLNAGLMAMNFVNGLHYKKIGSCFLQWSNKGDDEIKVKLKLGIPENEKIAVVIAAGYYPDRFISPASHRKEIKEFFSEL